MVDEVLECFHEDVAEKSLMARSSRANAATQSRLRHSDKKVTRIKPPKEIPMKYISWKKFKQMSTEDQRTYLQQGVDKFNVFAAAFARMWAGEVARQTCDNRFAALGIVRALPVGVKPKIADTNAFLEAYEAPHAKFVVGATKKSPASATSESTKTPVSISTQMSSVIHAGGAQVSDIIAEVSKLLESVPDGHRINQVSVVIEYTK